MICFLFKQTTVKIIPIIKIAIIGSTTARIIVVDASKINFEILLKIL
jgi:hypothetical protein